MVSLCPPQSSRARRILSLNPSPADHATVSRSQDNFVATSAAPSTVHEVPATAVDTPDISKPTISEKSLTLPATDPAAVADAAAYVDVDGDGTRRHRRYARCDQDKEREDRNDEYSQAHAVTPLLPSKHMAASHTVQSAPEVRLRLFAE